MKKLLFLLLIFWLPLSCKSEEKTNSVLASGNWYKIAVQEDGVYKISYSNLSNLGINTSNLSCSRIRIFGNGGGMLPNLNSDFRHDGLQENAILVVDNNETTGTSRRLVKKRQRDRSLTSFEVGPLAAEDFQQNIFTSDFFYKLDGTNI